MDAIENVRVDRSAFEIATLDEEGRRSELLACQTSNERMEALA